MTLEGIYRNLPGISAALLHLHGIQSLQEGFIMKIPVLITALAAAMLGGLGLIFLVM